MPVPDSQFLALGKDVKDLLRKLDTFWTPEGTTHVIYESDEVTAVCPVTGQPDWYTVTIDLEPEQRLIESKSLKLFLQSFRNEGLFCEALAALIAREIMEQVTPLQVSVTVKQKARGGITISSTSVLTFPQLAPDHEGTQS